MSNQYRTLIPSRLNYTPLTFHKTNNTEPKSIIEFNTLIYDDMIDHL